MNSQWHDKFVALCALFASGELTEEEWALLQVHLAYCDSCRVLFQEYQHVASDVVPLLAASAYSEDESTNSSFSLATAEQRLMNQLDSLTPEREPLRSRKGRAKVVAGLIAACVVGVASLIGLRVMRTKLSGELHTVAVTRVEPPQRASAPIDAAIDPRPRLESAQSEMAALRQKLNTLEDRDRRSSSTAVKFEQQLQAEQGEVKRIGEERDGLIQQLSIAQKAAQSFRDKSAEIGTLTAQQTTRADALEAKLHNLNTALDEKDHLLALDQEFLAHDREIRDLIGARNLYIADIYDVTQNGKTATPFGRVFYTKDRSLVFYGYDLDKQAGLKRSVAFQAWGSGDDKQNVSLGLFYQDDTHKRWVLRFNDTKTLARLNMVFVTAEPQGGSTKPTGKPLLMAYLQVQPNHP